MAWVSGSAPYNVPMVLTITSRASTLESRPMPIFQLKPRGAMAGSMKWPRRPMTLSASSGAEIWPPGAWITGR